MIGGLYNGISGVNAYMSSLNLTTNNIANVNTIAHKADEMSFEDMMYQNGQYGKGIAIGSVEKNFNQGTINDTGVSYDFAIQGKGFFVVQDPITNNNYYTRAGNFTESKYGILQNSEGLNVLGVQTEKTSVSSSNNKTEFDSTYSEFLVSRIIKTDTETLSINAKASNYFNSAEDVTLDSGIVKNSSAIISDIDILKINYDDKLNSYASNTNAQSIAPTSQEITLTFDTYEADLQSNSFVGLDINGFVLKENYEGSASGTMMNMAEKITNTINGLEASFDSATGIMTIKNIIPGNNASVSFTQDSFAVPNIISTDATKGSGLADVIAAREALKEQITLANGDFLNIENSIPASNQDTLVLNELNLQLSNLNISNNDDISFSVIDDGILLLTQGENSYIAGRVSTAYFGDQTALNPIGNNLYEATEESGEPKNADTLNAIVSNSIELSNVSLADGLQNLIIAQRAFEANAKSITTSDEFLKTAIQLKNS